MPGDDLQNDSFVKSTQATIYHALEDKIQRHHTFGFLHSEPNRASPATRYAATPRDALAARLGTTSDSIPTASPDTILPSSDLLDAIHGHTSNVFTRDYPRALRGMDESVLLLLGVIVEELAVEVIGEQGHAMLRQGPEKDSQECRHVSRGSDRPQQSDVYDTEASHDEKVEEFTWVNVEHNSGNDNRDVHSQSSRNDSKSSKRRRKADRDDSHAKTRKHKMRRKDQ